MICFLPEDPSLELDVFDSWVAGAGWMRHSVIMRVPGGVSHTNLGWSGGWGSVMDVVFLITRDVVAEGRHRAVSGVS